MKLASAAAMVAILVSAAAAHAFSPSEDSLLPANFDLVQEAKGIVLAKVTRNERDNDKSGHVTFTIIEVLKGDVTEKTLSTWAFGDPAKYSGAGTLGDFSRARPGTYEGMGIALDWKSDATYLLLLSKTKDQWSVGVSSLSRDREEVIANDPWITAVKHYIRIGSLNDYTRQKEALLALHKSAAEGRDPAAFPPGLVADIDRHFSMPYPSLSYADLREFYDNAKEERMKRQALYAMAQARYKEAAPLLREGLKRPDITFGVMADYMVDTQDAEGLATLFSIYAKFYADRPDSRDSLATALIRFAGPKDTPAMLEMLKVANPRAAEAFLPWFIAHAPKDALPEYHKRVKDYSDNTVWRLTIGLAKLGDEDVVKWALQELRNADRHPEEKQGALAGLVILGFSGTAAAAAELRQRLPALSTSLTGSVISVLGDPVNANPNRWDLLAGMAKHAAKEPEIAKALRARLVENKNPQAAKILATLPQP
jgi:hypothetical protein